jgi:hypothetical protein
MGSSKGLSPGTAPESRLWLVRRFCFWRAFNKGTRHMTLQEPQPRRRRRRRNDKSKTRTRRRPMPSPDAFAYTLHDAQKMGAPGRTKLYELEKEGRVEFVRIDGQTLVKGDSLRALLGVR